MYLRLQSSGHRTIEDLFHFRDVSKNQILKNIVAYQKANDEG